MIYFTTFFALVVAGMEVIQLAAATRVPAGLLPRTNLMNSFQRRQDNTSQIQCPMGSCALAAASEVQPPVISYPGGLGHEQNASDHNQPISSVVLPSSTVSSITSLLPQTTSQSTPGLSTSSTPDTSISQSTVTSINTPTPSSSSASSKIRSVEASCFNLITVAMMLGTWLYFAA